jgi:predicted unusual protein kinase regulating ubiquinone biosynthesis (AarF/ABC1/UbiB family)
VSDLPRRAVTRTAKLATLPVGLAGRTAWGLGKRLGGRPAEIVAHEIQQRTAEQIFRVLGELKGGALKLGQALSIFEAALPPEIASPYRATLTKLQESAPPLPADTVHKVLVADLGPGWRDNFADFNDSPTAAASIGQVHRATWQDGRQVAVKIQYPGAGKALVSDFTQLSRLGRLFSVLMPGLDVRPLLDELRKRVAEELDYRLEASSQEAFAAAYENDPEFYIPHVIAATDHVLVSEWMGGTPLSKIIAEGSTEDRNRAGILLVRFLFSGPSRAGLLHADPHPGNFRLLDDGRLGILDFGAVDRLPDGFPRFFGKLLRLMHEDRDIETVEHELRVHGFLKEGVTVDLDALHAYLAPLAEPSRVETFKFTREWLREEASRVTDIRSAAISRRLNMPPSYILIHRVSTAGIGVLCQLECEGQFRAEVIKWMPGYADPLDPVPDSDGPAADLDAEAEGLAADELHAEVEGLAAEGLDAGAGKLDVAAGPGRDDPDDARAGAASPNS